MFTIVYFVLYANIQLSKSKYQIHGIIHINFFNAWKYTHIDTIAK